MLLARIGARAGAGGKGRPAQSWLTGEGQALLPFCERLLGAAVEARKALAVQAAGQTGVITLGASQTIGTYVLPRLIAAFRHRHPQVRHQGATPGGGGGGGGGGRGGGRGGGGGGGEGGGQSVVGERFKHTGCLSAASVYPYLQPCQLSSRAFGSAETSQAVMQEHFKMSAELRHHELP